MFSKLIDTREVVNLLVPFPEIDSVLAQRRHMYICISKDGSTKKISKCQSFKPYMLLPNYTDVKCSIIENSNYERNPFSRKTMIDCDKVFKTINYSISRDKLTTIRPDVCKDLHSKIVENVAKQESQLVPLLTPELIALNERIV